MEFIRVTDTKGGNMLISVQSISRIVEQGGPNCVEIFTLDGHSCVIDKAEWESLYSDKIKARVIWGA